MWAVMVISFIAFLILEIIFFCVVSLGTSNLGHYGSLHRILWIVPEKCALVIQRLAQKIRTEAVQVGVAGVAAAEPLVVALGAVLRELGVVGGAMVRGVIVVTAGMVQGVAEVAHGVENVMAACRNEAQATVVEDPEASSPPPPYFQVVSILFLSVCFTAHQDHRDLIV